MSIQNKLLLSFLAIFLLFTSLLVFLIFQVKQQKSDIETMRAEFVQTAFLARDLKLNVVQVQQWLTDISATRAMEGFDDGFTMAEEHARNFYELLEDLKGVVPQEADYLQSIRSSFDEYYNMGKTMAQAYIDGGPEQGNLMMQEFDQFVVDLNNKIEKFNQDAITSMEESIARLESETSKTIFMVQILAAIIFALIMILSYTTSRSIVRPLRLVNNQLKDIADGEGDLTQEISVRSKDEIGQLAESFNRMTGKLRQLISQVGISMEQVASSSQELTASAEQTNRLTEQITLSIQDSAKGAEEQLAKTIESEKALEEISQGNLKIAESAAIVSDLASDTFHQAEKGEELIRKAVQQMYSINQSVEGSDHSIRLLDKRSQEIGQILEVITGISEQTNLLALNAAIEAARAGEQGKGFAVVADEVRKLAEQSGISSKQIAELIGEIQREMSNSINAMNHVKKEVTTGTAVANEAEQKFAEIIHSVRQITGRIQEISETARQISAGSQQSKNSVKEMSAIARNRSADAESDAASAQEQLASMEEIAASASALSQMAEELQEKISKFKV